MKAGEIVKALTERHKSPQWVTCAELRFGTGWAASYSAGDPYTEKRIDFWAMDTWPSHGYKRVAYEIKVSRGDFKRELTHPDKRTPSILVSNEFYFAAPRGLIKPDELPEGCGLVEVNEHGTARLSVKAAWRDTQEPTWGFIAALLRRVPIEPGVVIPSMQPNGLTPDPKAQAILWWIDDEHIHPLEG